MVVGRSPLIARLLVWAVAVVVIDVAVIATGNDHGPAASRAQADATTTTTVATTSTTAPSESTTTILADGQPTTTVETTTTTTTTPATADTTPPASTPSSEVVVAHLQGNDNPSTASFRVEGRWEVRWHVVDGEGVAATIENDDQPGNPFFAPITPGDGSGDFPEGCNCTLHLEPEGSSYDVVVVDVAG